MVRGVEAQTVPGVGQAFGCGAGAFGAAQVVSGGEQSAGFLIFEFLLILCAIWSK